MGDSFGHLFRITTWGESHGPSVGVVIDGCPAGLSIGVDEIQADLDRRRPGQSRLASQRKEPDRATILSGWQDGVTLGTALAIAVHNEDARAKDYGKVREAYRPSHADYTYQMKYGVRANSGGGRASARETVARVAAGAVARKLLQERFGVDIVAWVAAVADLQCDVNPLQVQHAEVDATPVRCPDSAVAAEMAERIDGARKQGDSLGGIVGCVARGVPPGWGEPVFDKLEADLGKGILSIPACKAFEIGSGFGGTRMRGSQHNDPFVQRDGQIRTASNRSGGIQGGISNGEAIVLRAGFKPTATIATEQRTVTVDGEPTTLLPGGRHDPCVVPRAVPIVEAMTAVVLVDHALRQQTARAGMAGSGP